METRRAARSIGYSPRKPMPGRYTLKTDARKLAERFGLGVLPEFPPRYNLGPTQDGLVIRAGNKPHTREAVWLRWGLIPSWSKDGGGAPLLMNARGETVADKPAFRDSLKRRRCLVIADGYYEWAPHGTVKQPYYLTVNRGEPFAMAGLWDRWCPPGGCPDDAIESYTIITTAPNELIAPMHDRMPVILEPDFHEDWINPLLLDTQALRPLIKPYPGIHMFVRAVSSRVNNVKHDDPACLSPPGDASDASPPGMASRASEQNNDAGAQLDLDIDN